MQNIIKLTNDFILKNGIKDLPLDLDGLVKICGSLGYKVRSYSQAREAIQVIGMADFMKYSAFTCNTRVHKWVFFDDNLSVGTRNFVIAHEIGHIVLRHNYDGAVGYTEADTEQEQEANTFAYQLLAPLCVLKSRNIFDIDDIESHTLLDTRHAKVIHKSLHDYRGQPRADEMVRAYGIVQPRQKFDFTALLIALMCLLVAFALVFREIPDPQPTVETTDNIIAVVRQQRLTETSRITTAIEPQTTTISPEQNETVYITKSGERYHKQNCYHIKNSTTVSGVPLPEAVEEGYTSCKSCYK